MAESVGPPRSFGGVIGCLGILLTAPFWDSDSSAQIQGSAGQETTKPFTATVALREGYDSNPLTQPYSSTQDIVSSTYTSVQPSLGYNYLGLQADAALRYDFTGTYWPSINQSYDIQYSHTFIGRYTFAFNPRFSITIADNFLYSEQPIPQLVTEGLAPVTQVNGFINNLGTIQADYRVSDRLSMITRWNNTLVNSDSLGSFTSNNSNLIDSGSNAQSNYMNNGARQEFRLDFTPETVAPYIEDNQVFTVAVEDKTAEEIAADTANLAARMRTTRDKLLADTDWMVIKALETNVALDTAWAQYRQALRDLPTQQGFPNIDLPAVPGAEVQD